MNENERLTIRKFAAGQVNLRERAIQIHRRHLPVDKESPEQLFMRKIDNPVPDLALRAKYRQALLVKENA